ncbi:hypothetical protein PM082_023235 [Marasmius tenuissimus]|nr:hypothetical protein PM082_023235 [Marasmius tenuissimus]
MELGIDTPFSHVLNTNYPPSIEEKHSIRDLIREPEEQIRLLDEEMSRLQTRRQKLKQFVDLHRALLSPFRQLTADVWRMIFFETLPDNILGLCTRTTKSSPLLLTTICRLWREVALSTPRLWNSIHIHLPIESSNSPDPDCITALHRRKEGFKAWLDRSGSLPVTISLTATPNQNGQSVAIAEPLHAIATEFIELLVQYSSRWRTVAFNSGVHLLDLTPIKRLPTNSLSNLESFCSSGALRNDHRTETVTNVDHLQNLLTKARSLRRLRLVDDTISPATLSLPMSWHHLTELTIARPVLLDNNSSFEPSQLMQTLADKCRSLITLSIDLDVMPAPETTLHPVRWSSLQNLRVVLSPFMSDWQRHFTSTNASDDTTFRPFVIPIFDSVTLPSLEKLSVAFGSSYRQDGDQATQLPFENLLQRSQCPITHFELFYPHIVTAEAVIRVVRQMETLVSLNLGYMGRERRWQSSPGVFVELSGPGVDQTAPSRRRKNLLNSILREFLVAGLDSDVEALPLCPLLEELNIGGCTIDDRDALLDFTQKTRRANLRSFRADLGQPVRSDVWKIFETLQVERQDSEKMRAVQDVGGIMVDWRWDEQSPEISRSLLDAPTTGLPEEGSL